MGAAWIPSVFSCACLLASCHNLDFEIPGLPATSEGGSAAALTQGGDGGSGASEIYDGSAANSALAGEASGGSLGAEGGAAGERSGGLADAGSIGTSSGWSQDGGVGLSSNQGGGGGGGAGAGAGAGGSGSAGADPEGVRNAGAVDAWPSGPVEARAVVDLVGNDGTTNYCTGTVVQPSWVLTAKRCLVSVNAPVNSVRASSTVVRYVDEVVARTDPAELQLVHLADPFTDIPQIGLTPGATSTLYMKLLDSYGYGARLGGGSCLSDAQCALGWSCVQSECLRPSTQLLLVQYTAGSDTSFGPELVDLLGGSHNLPGDFGGPSFYNGALAGVHIAPTTDLSVASYHDWIDTPSRSSFVTADFNHDGVTDYVVTTVEGSSWYYSTSLGTWRLAYQRPDLVLGAVQLTPGDFDGDGWTDLIVTLATGSLLFYSNDSTVTPWLTPCAANTTSQFTLGSQDFTVGDFDGNGKADFVVDSRPGDVPEGSNFYYSLGRCNWNNTAYSRPDLTWGKVKYTAADFNGDGKTDLIVSEPTGTSWLLSQGIDDQGVGHWLPFFSRSDLKVGEVTFAPADYDGDGRSDVIATTSAGAEWLFSRQINGSDTLVVGYSRADLTAGKVVFTPGDFDGDGKADVAITGWFGTYWYYSTETLGQFFIPPPIENLKRGAVQYSVGEFDGKGGADLIVTTASGSDWYLSNGAGAWTVAYSTGDHL